MNRYNPYSVPENFFETVRNDAIVRRNRTRKSIALTACVMMLAGIMVAVPYLSEDRETEQRMAEQTYENLNDMYNNDIFLLVSNF